MCHKEELLIEKAWNSIFFRCLSYKLEDLAILQIEVSEINTKYFRELGLENRSDGITAEVWG